MKTSFQKLQSGFTLIELLITIGIIAILGVIAVPIYKDYRIQAVNSGIQQEVQKFAAVFAACSSTTGNICVLPGSAGEADSASEAVKDFYNASQNVGTYVQSIVIENVDNTNATVSFALNLTPAATSVSDSGLYQSLQCKINKNPPGGNVQEPGQSANSISCTPSITPSTSSTPLPS